MNEALGVQVCVDPINYLIDFGSRFESDRDGIDLTKPHDKLDRRVALLMSDKGTFAHNLHAKHASALAADELVSFFSRANRLVAWVGGVLPAELRHEAIGFAGDAAQRLCQHLEHLVTFILDLPNVT